MTQKQISVGIVGANAQQSCECTIEGLVERRLIRFQGIHHKTHLQSKATAHNTDNETIALISQKPYHSSSMFWSPMFLLHQPS